MRGVALQLLGLYAIITAAPLGLGLWLFLMPGRAGNFLHESFLIFPEVQDDEWPKQFLYRILGLAFMGVGAYYVISIYRSFVSAS